MKNQAVHKTGFTVINRMIPQLKQLKPAIVAKQLRKLEAACRNLAAVYEEHDTGAYGNLNRLYLRRANEMYTDEGRVEIDDTATVSISENGAYVQAWVWVANCDFETTTRSAFGFEMDDEVPPTSNQANSRAGTCSVRRLPTRGP